MFLFLAMAAESIKNSFDNGTELALKAKKGDISAFEDLVRRFERFVFTTIFFDVKNSEDAYDLSQEVFLKVYRALPSFRADSAFSSWLYRICKNTSYDFLRKANKTKTVSISSLVFDDSEKADFDIPDDDYKNNPEEAYEKEERAMIIQKAIEELSEDHKEVIILREIDGYSYAEISGILGIEEGTVKSRIARARENLRNSLSDKSLF